MAEISQIKLPDNTVYDLKDTTARNTGKVSGVKGNSESYYRTGNVNLTSDNIGAVAKNAELLTTNPFAPSIFKGPYISKIDNAFYAADKRWNVTMTNISTGNTVAKLFDGNYDSNVKITDGKTSILTIDFSTESTGYFPGYPYGYILVSFYYAAVPQSVSGRVYCNYEAHGIGWHNLNFTNISEGTTACVYRSDHQGYYSISKIEITIVGDTTNIYGCTQISQIEMHLDRPDSNRNPFLNKYGPETLYYELIAPRFTGPLTGDVTGTASGNLTSNSTLNAAKLSGTIPTSCYTDTKNTAGSTDTNSKIFLIGATSQAANPQTYSHDTAYVGTNGHLYSASKEVLVGGSNGNSTVTITPSTTDVYSMTSAGSVTAGTATTPASLDTSKFNGGSFTRGAFTAGSLTFTIDQTDNKQLNISFTAPSHAADSFTAASLGNGFYTAGTKGTPTAVTLPTRSSSAIKAWTGYSSATAAAQTFTGQTS